MPQQDPYASIATADPYASIATAGPVYKDPYGTPQGEVENFLAKNPNYQWLDSDPKFPLRQPGIYPKGAEQSQLFQEGKLKGQAKPVEMQTDQWPVDLHEARDLYHGAKIGALGATSPLVFFSGASLPQWIGGVVGGAGGSAAASKGAKALGAGETGQEVAGDVGGLAGGVLGGGIAGRVAPKITSAAAKARAIWESLPEDVQGELDKLRESATGMVAPKDSRLRNAWNFSKTVKGLYDRFFGAGAGEGEAPTQDADVLRDRIGNSQPSTPLDRLRNQPVPPEVNYTPDRPSIERIMPDQAAPGAAGSIERSIVTNPKTGEPEFSDAAAVAPKENPVNSLFPPPKGKFQYDPSRFNQPTERQGPTFDTNGITRDIDEDKAIEDAWRADLGKHGTIARIQQNREFAAGHSMDTPKGVMQEQAANSKAGAALIDAGVPNMGSPVEPVEFINGVKGFKLHGRWLMQKGSDWVGVTNEEMKGAVAPTASGQSSVSSAPRPADQDLTSEWSAELQRVLAQKGKKGK